MSAADDEPLIPPIRPILPIPGEATMSETSDEPKSLTPPNSEDERTLRRLGHKQELSRRMTTFSNILALSARQLEPLEVGWYEEQHKPASNHSTEPTEVCGSVRRVIVARWRRGPATHVGSWADSDRA